MDKSLTSIMHAPWSCKHQNTHKHNAHVCKHEIHENEIQICLPIFCLLLDFLCVIFPCCAFEASWTLALAPEMPVEISMIITRLYIYIYRITAISSHT